MREPFSYVKSDLVIYKAEDILPLHVLEGCEMEEK